LQQILDQRKNITFGLRKIFTSHLETNKICKTEKLFEKATRYFWKRFKIKDISIEPLKYAIINNRHNFRNEQCAPILQVKNCVIKNNRLDTMIEKKKKKKQNRMYLQNCALFDVCGAIKTIDISRSVM
jgi:hypothetical protein